MLRLDLPKEPYWIDLPHGVRVRVAPLTTAVYEAARAKGNAAVRDLVAREQVVEDAGGRVVDLPDMSDPHVRTGMAEFLFVAALAQVGILEWEGVGDADGNLAPVTQENVRALMSRHDMAEMFIVRYSRPLIEAQAEGNGSGSAPNGISEEAEPIADDAESKISPAPEAKSPPRKKSAHIKSTARPH